MTWTSTTDEAVTAVGTLADLVAAVAAGAGDRPAVIDGETGEATGYAELAARIERLAAAWAKVGVQRGDAVALWAPNCPAWLEAAFGAMAAGAIPTGIGPAATEPELHVHLRDTGARVVVTVPRLVATAGRAPGVERVVVLGRADGAVPFERLLDGADAAVRPGHDRHHAPLRPRVDARAGRAPPHHDARRAAAGHVGAGPQPRRRPPRPLLGAVHRAPRRSTGPGAAPGGGRAPPGRGRRPGLRDDRDRPIGALPDRDAGSAPGSVGRATAGQQLRVADPVSGAELPRGEVGELLHRGPHVMAGYLDRPQATAQILDPDGWLHSGDLGYVGEDGDVFIVDRIKELIKVSAHQVSPAELEAVLITHPAVADVAVIPRPHPLQGEVPVAVVVAGEEVDGDELREWVSARVSPYKRLRAVRFAEAIPRTSAGKILRRLLIEDDRQPA